MSEPQVSKKYGGIMPKGKLYLTQHIAEVEEPGTKKLAYEIAVLPDMSPVIQSVATGKRWHVNWKRLVELAIAEGVDEPWEKDDVASE